MNRLRTTVRVLSRFAAVWVVDMLSLLATASLVPGIAFAGTSVGGQIVMAASAALLLGLVNLLVRPLILLLSLPFGAAAILAVSLFVNTITLLITSALLPEFSVNGPLLAFVGGIVFAAINTVVSSVVTVSEEHSLYQNIVERLAARTPFANAGNGQRGLVLLEIDGLSYWHMQKALADGWMPTLAAMSARHGYRLTRVDCGLPAQTSACQAGIMFGDNYDIPAYRWFDKEQGKLYISGRDAAEINARYAKGHGLLRDGSSISNMMDGDAEKSQLTMAAITTDDAGENWRRAEDFYLLMLNPYFLMRALMLYGAEVVRELWQGWRQRLHNVTPRLDRTAGFYPFQRAAATVLLREVAASLAILDIIRGSPSIYVTWPGYDEVAHHAGPWSRDALQTLRHYDLVIERIRRTIHTKAARPYDLIILSDHGQSSGATFRQRYGHDLKSFLAGWTARDAAIAHLAGGDEANLSFAALGQELQNIETQKAGGVVGRAVARRGHRLTQRADALRQSGETPAPGVERADVIVCASGNLAHIYFDLAPRKLALHEIERFYPGMVAALVGLEGLGFIVGYNAQGEAVVLGKRGSRNLATGTVDGDDPLLPYAVEPFATVALRARQVRRIAAFPHAGDLIVNSALYADGTVAALEELIGSHGGLGGEQTDAFIFHPPDMIVPATQNATDLFPILNRRRGATVAAGAN